LAIHLMSANPMISVAEQLEQSTRTAYGRMRMMCSTPDSGNLKAILRFVLLGGIAAGLTGCAHAQKSPGYDLSQAPLIIDPAMQQRSWSQSVAYEPNGGVPAYDTRFNFTPPAHEPAWVKPVTEPIDFIGQTLFLPVTLVTSRPFDPVVFHGYEYGSTSTAFPAPPKASPTTPGAASNAANSPDAAGADGAH
jgi:hypothetical protein